MFVANTLTAWVEALKVVFHDDPDYAGELKNIAIHTEYPMAEIDYPGLWVNYSMQGDVKNVGIGHEEYYLAEVDDTNYTKALRWHYGGILEITIGAMGNLERANLIDELTRVIAIGRVDENPEGELRKHIEQHDLVGQIVTWESFTVGAFAESPGTPWGTDDVIYEATITLSASGEVVLSPTTGTLVPLSAIIATPLRDDETGLPVPGGDGWI